MCYGALLQIEKAWENDKFEADQNDQTPGGIPEVTEQEEEEA